MSEPGLPMPGGEDTLVAGLLARLPLPRRARGVLVGAGEDDCAAVRRLPKSHLLLLKTDCVIEGVHFLPETAPEQVGWKALCRALSDIAASGGKPLHALVTLALSRERTWDWASRVYTGLGRAANEYGVTVVGGDTASTPGPSLVSIALTGSVHRNHHVTRGGGRPGDLLYVTGQLGGSFSTGKHLRFTPRLGEGRWLGSRRSVRAMMDLSDGLAADLPRLARASGTGFALLPESLPRTSGCNVAQALGDGEDYELLLAVSPQAGLKLERSWMGKFPELTLTQIGTLEEAGTELGLASARGFDHFATSTPVSDSAR